ncbi:MAG: NUDIX hydrolase [Candidatus Moranbacteria bacterium]|nr:NUDIX hydrolase [Candidatus Moranbacteria bacterium]
MDKVQPWKELSREEVFRKYSRVIEKVMFRLPDGRETDFYLQGGHDPICCLPMTKDGKVILARQYRPGPAKVVCELPGGSAKEGETPEVAVARELLEETGYRGTLQYVATLLVDAYASSRRHAFVVTDCEKIAEPRLEDNGENVEAVLMTLSEFRTHLRSGQLTDVNVGYLGLDYLGLL